MAANSVHSNPANMSPFKRKRFSIVYLDRSYPTFCLLLISCGAPGAPQPFISRPEYFRGGTLPVASRPSLLLLLGTSPEAGPATEPYQEVYNCKETRCIRERKTDKKRAPLRNALPGNTLFVLSCSLTALPRNIHPGVSSQVSPRTIFTLVTRKI